MSDYMKQLEARNLFLEQELVNAHNQIKLLENPFVFEDFRAIDNKTKSVKLFVKKVIEEILKKPSKQFNIPTSFLLQYNITEVPQDASLDDRIIASIRPFKKGFLKLKYVTLGLYGFNNQITEREFTIQDAKLYNKVCAKHHQIITNSITQLL